MKITLLNIRWLKTGIMACVAGFCILVVFNNTTDYGSNFQFVSHVMAMDTTFEGNSGLWRRIENPILHHAAFWGIIAVEFIIAFFCTMGAFAMARSIDDVARYSAAKRISEMGLGLGVVLWFGGFVGVGGEWFLMWQSAQWNGKDSAQHFAIVMLLILLYIRTSEGDYTRRIGAPSDSSSVATVR